MTDKHTPEPWRVIGDSILGKPQEMNEAGPLVCAVSVTDSDDEDKENRRRIVACVNACAGLPTEILERGPVGWLCRMRAKLKSLPLLTVEDGKATLRSQDDPLAELRDLEGEPEDDGPEGGGSIRA